MAKIYRLDDGAKMVPNSERIVLRALGTLSDDWHIFHSVRWQSVRHGRQGDGEADFIIVNRERGILVLEVKGGDVRIDNGRWTSVGHDGQTHEIRNPFAQASDSKHALIAFLSELDPRPHNMFIGHAVAFPSVDLEGRLAPYAARETMLCASDLLNPLAAIERAFAHWNLNRAFSIPDLQRIIRLLAPTVEVRKTLKVDIARSEAEILRLTAEQQRIFASLRGVRRLTVVGGPGTGKTLLALTQVRSLAEQGFHTRLVCYNELLSKAIAATVGNEPKIEVSTFHSLCLREARRCGIEVPAAPSQAWWDDGAPDMLSKAIASRGPRCDALIVDEGQDFAPSWFAALATDLVVPESAPIYVFADDRQELRRREWQRGVPFDATYALSENCRNTLPIARRLSALYDEPGPERGADGAPPAIFQFGDGDDVIAMALELAERLLDQEGLTPSDLTLLCDDPVWVGRLRDTYVAGVPISGYDGGGIVCETVSRFKGLETPALLLMLSDDGRSARDRTANAYVGLSRARSAAVVLARTGHPVVEAFDQVRQRR